MKRPPDPGAPEFGWKRQRSRHGVEFFHYPSELARQLWFYPFAVGRATTPPSDTNLNRPRNVYLLHFVTRGALRLEVANRVHVARAGEAFLTDVSRGGSHRAEGGRAAVSYWVSFNGKDMVRHFAELRADRIPIFSGLNAARMAALFRELRQMTAREDAGYEPRASGLLQLMLAELYAARARAQPMEKLGDRLHLYSEPVRKGIDWLVRMCASNPDQLSIKSLADAVGCSRSHYTRRFRADTGVSPIAWLNRYRVEQAKRLLAQTDKPVAEVAAAAGIPNQNYFARLFRARAGTTPLKYRMARRARPRRAGAHNRAK